MKRRWRVSALSRVLLLSLAGARVCRAEWDLTKAGDHNRSWGISATEAGEYDDNWNSTEANRESGFRLNSDIKLRATIPVQRLFIGMLYDYGILYPNDPSRGGIDQTHNVNVSANYVVNPRLALQLSESFVSSLQPGIVLGPNGVPVSISSAGNYIYDAVAGGANYVLTPRWSTSINGNWDIWRYQSSSIASNNDHEDYAATVSVLYALDSRTTAGLNYQYSQNTFSNPGTNDALNGYSDTAYLSLVHIFNPRLSLTLNGGYTVRNSADGSVNSSPSGSAGLVYNYGPLSSVSLTIAQSLTEASVGVTSSFSAQQNTTVALQVNHRLTAKLNVVLNGTYAYSTFTAPLPGLGTTLKPNEQAATVHIGFSYAFSNWLSAVLNYSYTEVVSSEPALIQPYDRNQVGLGVTLSY